MKITFTSLKEQDIQFFKEKLRNFNLKFFNETIDKIPLEEIQDTEILSIFVFDRLNEKLILKLKKLKLIITRSAGVDHIDIEYCKKRGIKIAHMPAYSPKSIAEHTLAMILTLTRKLKKIGKNLEKMDYSQSEDIIGVDLDELSIGIIGTGKIGSWTAKLCKYLGMKVYAFDLVESEELKEMGIEYLDLDTILKIADIISLHVPYTPQTHHLINKERINKMKKGAILINTARGAVVDIDALYEALKNKKIAGAGLDVFEDEDILILNRYEDGKVSDKNLKILKLNTLENVIITPHIAYYTRKAVNNIRNCTVDCINLFIKEGKLGKFEVI